MYSKIKNTITYHILKKNKLGISLTTVGILGLGYLCYKGEKLNENYYKYLSKQEKVAKSIEHERTKDTLVYFASSIGITSIVSNLILSNKNFYNYANSPISKLISIPLSFFTLRSLERTQNINYTRNKSLYRTLLFALFNTNIAISMSPLLNYMGKDIMKKAFVLTGGCFSGLGLYSYFCKGKKYLNYGGILGGCMGGMTAVGLANMFLRMPIMYDIWLYGGLGVFLGYTLYDLKNVRMKAKRAMYFDPILESLNLYTDFVNVFLRTAGIIEDQKIKKEEDNEYHI